MLAFLGLQNLGPGWRTFFLVGLIPLAVIAFGRRSMLETERYEAVRADERGEHLDHTSIFEPWKPAYRTTVLAVGLVTFFRYFVISAGAFWWAYYAQQEIGMSVATSGLYLAAAGHRRRDGIPRGGQAHGPDSGASRCSRSTWRARWSSAYGRFRPSTPGSSSRCSVSRSSSVSDRSR